MQRDSEDEAWRAIVENYGDRPELDEPSPEPAPSSPSWRDAYPDDEPLDREAGDPGERFVPPPTPPLPRPPRDRFLAWLGLFGSPTVLLVCLVTGVQLPSLLAYALVAAFVGGFLYLVVKMPRGPRDPWDDGAQV